MSLSKYIAKQFGNPSGIGGRIVTAVMNCQNRDQYRAALDNLELKSEDTVLDIGFGNGYLIGRLLKQKPDKISGIELSRSMLTKVAKNYRKAVLNGTLDLRLADVKALPFADGSFDKVCSVNTVYFWTDTDKSFTEIARTLKPGGVFVNVFYGKDFLDRMPHAKYGYEKYTAEQVVTMTEKSELEVIRVVELMPGESYCIVAWKNADY
jgi:Methylase involved in ubiquinone/menaquinone biosynthesis